MCVEFSFRQETQYFFPQQPVFNNLKEKKKCFTFFFQEQENALDMIIMDGTDGPCVNYSYANYRIGVRIIGENKLVSERDFSARL